MAKKTSFRKKLFFKFFWPILFGFIILNSFIGLFYIWKKILPRKIIQQTVSKMAKVDYLHSVINFNEGNVQVVLDRQSKIIDYSQISVTVKDIVNIRNNNLMIYGRYNKDNLYLSGNYSRMRDFEKKFIELNPDMKDDLYFLVFKQVFTQKKWLYIDLKLYFSILTDALKSIPKSQQSFYTRNQLDLYSKKISDSLEINNFQIYFDKKLKRHIIITVGVNKNKFLKTLEELNKQLKINKISIISYEKSINSLTNLENNFIEIYINDHNLIKKININPYLISNKQEKILQKKPFLSIDFSYGNKTVYQKPDDHILLEQSYSTGYNKIGNAFTDFLLGDEIKKINSLQPQIMSVKDYPEIYQPKLTGKTPEISSGKSVDKELYMIHNMLSRYFSENGYYPNTLDPLAYKYFPDSLPINPVTGQQFYYAVLKDRNDVNKGFFLCPAQGLSNSYCIKKWEMYEVY